MDNSTLAAWRGLSLGRSRRILAATVVAALALVVAWFVLLQQPADAQINIRQIACPILIPLRNAFANSPFFSFVAGILDALIAAFGCGVS
jgi:hypothetical protein